MPQRSKCRECAGGCYVIPESCLYAGGTMFTEGLVKSRDVLPYMQEAQRIYLGGNNMLGRDCLTDLCAAINEYETNGTAIPAKWADVIREVTPLLVAATEYLFFRKRGMIRVVQDGLLKFDTTDEGARALYSDMLKGMQASVADGEKAFMEWLDDNRAAYACLPSKPCGEGADLKGMPGRRMFDGVGGNPMPYLGAD